MSAYHHNRHYRPLRQPYHRSGNPYFRSRSADHLGISRLKNTTARWSFKTWLVIILTSIVAILLVWLFLFSPFFLIKKIQVSGAEISKADNITRLGWDQTKKRRWFVIPQSRLLTFNSAHLEAIIRGEYIFESIKIRKKLFGTINIDIKEKLPAALWFENDTYYVLDAEGFVLAQEMTVRPDLPLLHNNATPVITLQQLPAESRVILQRGIELSQFTSSQFSYVKPKHITIPPEHQTIVLVLGGGQLIYFSTRQEIGPQIEKLDTLLKTELKNRLPAIDYIDLRFGDKIYYK